MDKTVIGQFLETFGGGEKFFDAIDHHIKYERSILNELFDMATIQDAYPYAGIIMSGEIGMMARNFGFPVDILVNGNLRKGAPIIDLKPFINPKGSYIIIDDSYYSGKTVNAITAEVARYGGEVVAVVVAYDGSPDKVENLYSLYSYYIK